METSFDDPQAETILRVVGLSDGGRAKLLNMHPTPQQAGHIA